MKITIELTEEQVKGIKSYLREVSGDVNPKITKADIVTEIRNIVDGSLQAGAISDHINNFS